MRFHILVEPDGKVGVAAVDFIADHFKGRRRKIGRNPLQLCKWRVNAQCLHMGKFFRNLTAIFVSTDFVDKNFDPRFVDIIAAAIAVIDAQTGLDIAQQIISFDERIDFWRDHRCAAHAAADKDARAKHAILLDQL